VDTSTLELVASSGISAVGLDRLSGLADYCKDWCVITGDARFCLLSDLFGYADGRVDDQGLPSAMLAELDLLLKEQLPPILTASESGFAASLARELGREVATLLAQRS
jgi:hypothetical protein